MKKIFPAIIEISAIINYIDITLNYQMLIIECLNQSTETKKHLYYMYFY